MKNEQSQLLTSRILTALWMLLLIPMTLLFFMMGVSTLMLSDSGAGSSLHISLMLLSCLFFWATPVLTLGSLLVSFYFRKKAQLKTSILIQLSPLLSSLLAFLLLFLCFCFQ